MKAYKVEILIIDMDELGTEEIKNQMENVKYPNYCLSPHIMDIKEADIGEWSDNHPLNKNTTWKEEYKKLFGHKTNI